MINENVELFVMRVLAGYDPIYGHKLEHCSFWKSVPSRTAFTSIAANFDTDYSKKRLKIDSPDFM